MNRIISFFFIVLSLFPLSSQSSGKISEIFFRNSTIIIEHSNCLLGQPIKEEKKLIIPLENCEASSQEIKIPNNHLIDVHWGQHEPSIVWVVATFSQAYQFEIITYPNRYVVCLPSCQDQTKKQLTVSSPPSLEIMFVLNSIPFQIPLENMLIDEFLDRSIGFVPVNIIKDGLPNFGSKRDDWKGKARKHTGYDVYVDKVNVIASAPGIVTQVGKSYKAGLYIKLHHGHNLYTVYVHVIEASVKEGQKVKQGDIIGKINGPNGNAVAPQLHFEVKINNESVDPLPFIENLYAHNNRIMEKIKSYKEALSELERYRDKKVQEFLNAR